MTRTLPAALLFTLAFAHAAAAQPSDSAEPSGTRLLVGPTGRALEHGQFYVDFSVLVGGPFAQVGMTDRFSVGAGTPILIPGIAPGDVMVVTPKMQIYSSPKLYASVGVLQFAGRKITPAGVAYAVVTRGSSDAAFTTGVSFTYGGLRQAERARTPLVVLGGEKRLTSHLKFITENYAGVGGGTLGGGLRMTRGHRTVDLGVMAVLGVDRPVVAPVFRFAWGL